jgi:hypothetical protein
MKAKDTATLNGCQELERILDALNHFSTQEERRKNEAKAEGRG